MRLEARRTGARERSDRGNTRRPGGGSRRGGVPTRSARRNSVLTPGTAIWTVGHATELLTKFNGRPDVSGASFEDKLAKQLADASPDAVQLFAELYALDLLPLRDYNPATKRRLVTATLALAGRSVSLPPVLDRAFDVGVLNGGVAFKTRRFVQLCYLIEFAAGLLSKPADERSRLMSDPIEFRAALDAVTRTSAQSQRATLLVLFFPDFFFPIANENHRTRIRNAFASTIGGLTDDEDQDLHNIYAAMLAEIGRPFSFYRSPVPGTVVPPAPRHPTLRASARGSSEATTSRATTWSRSGSMVAG